MSAWRSRRNSSRPPCGSTRPPEPRSSRAGAGLACRLYCGGMGLRDTGHQDSWAPQACTLPTSERPLRAAEFDGFFSEAVLGVERAGPGRLRLELRASPQVAVRAAELMAAETACCSFFTFTLTATNGRLVLDVAVPAAHVGVLAALADRAMESAEPGTATG